MKLKPFLLLLTYAFLLGCNRTPDTSQTSVSTTVKPVPAINFDHVNSYPHDTTSFTEGFLIHDGKLYESTGATSDLPQTRSLFGVVDFETGKIDTKVELDRNKFFGEGIAFLKGKVFQLTYKTRLGFIYNATTFKKLGEFTFPSDEGWGLTTDGANLIMSDGTNILTFLDSETLQATKTISVSENGYATDYLNELEYINGYVYANIWTTNRIVKINLSDGKIVGELDLTSLANEARNLYRGSLEMNGIAYDSIQNRIFVTGKLWPKIFEIKFSH